MLIHIFLDSRIITGKKNIMVATIEMNVLINEVPISKYEIIKAATANAIPTA